MSVGTYTVLLERVVDGEIDVGALGEMSFPAGWYAYTGSAFGPGGLGRVDRHERVATGENDARHWHVDYLLGDEDTELVDAVTSVGADEECEIANGVDGRRVADFGCSDCDCESHLVYRREREPLVDAVERCHREAAD